MTVDIKIQQLVDQKVPYAAFPFFRFGSDTLPNTETISQSFKIAASASNTAVTLQEVETDMTRFVIVEDLSGGDTITCKINGGATALGVKPHLILSQDLTAISFSNSDTVNPIYVRVIRGVAGAATGSVINTGSIAPVLSVTITTDTTLTTNNRTVFINAASNDIDVTLPTAASMTDRYLDLIRIDVGSYVVTIDANGAELINQGSTYILSNEQAIRLYSNGTQWYIE